jgi:phage terminase small subunit
MAGVKGRSGRPRLSADEHRLRGTYRADRHDPVFPVDPEPVDPGSIPEAPQDLVASERRYWEYFAPLLGGARLLTPADVETLADYCRACVCVADRARRVRTAYGKRPLNATLVRLLDSQWRAWVEKKTRLASELGLTAVARTRINWTGYAPRRTPPRETAPPEPPPSTFAQLQARAALLRRPIG